MEERTGKELLSVCMIVRNESQLLGDCLDSVAGVADQIVVLDTGSEDNTVEIARSKGAEVHSFDWCDDFAAARNASLRYTRGKWILWLDADERLAVDSVSALQNIVQHAGINRYYRVTLKNRTREAGNYQLTSAHRLFPNRQGFKFRGKIHEHILPPAGSTRFSEAESGVVIEHLGYALSEEITAKKEQRNRKLLEQMVAENPRDAFACFNLAQHLDLHENLREAERHYQKVLSLKTFSPPMTAVVLNNLAGLSIKKADYDAARRYALQSVKIKTHQVGGYYHLYRVAHFTQNQDEELRWLRKLDEISARINAQNPALPSDLMLEQRTIKFTLARILHKQHQWREAGKLLRECLSDKPNDRETLGLLADIALKEQDIPAARKYLETLYQNHPDHLAAGKLLATLQIKQKDFSAAIATYEKLLERFPADVEVLKRLIGLHGATGALEKARQLGQVLAGLQS